MRFIIGSAPKPRSPYSYYLRTGRWPEPIEHKFNPNHDPHDGHFTVKGGGSGPAPGAKREVPNHETHPRPPQNVDPNSPYNPRNQSTYTVQSGDTLTHIAATRMGLSVADVAKLNGLSPEQPLQIGQKLILPTQNYLDDVKRGFDKAAALNMYMHDHSGNLPHDINHPPSAIEQALGPGSRKITANGYDYELDAEGRTRFVSGTIRSNPDQSRSAASQRDAGGADRLPTDQGGHYIARRFDGPRDAFNHFAQDANFNRSGYRKLENRWAQTIARGERVHVPITPLYSGHSQRPGRIIVDYTVGRVQHVEDFPNKKR